MKIKVLLVMLTILFNVAFSQDAFDYQLELTPVEIQDLPGIHSYAFAQHDGKWLVIGGRLDGLHARQPFNTFPQPYNNSNIYVLDINAQQFWTASVNSLPTGLSEQLQSTNMNFYQDGDSLYIIGGYAYSPSTDDHITFPYLTSIQVSSLIEAVISGSPISTFFKQITDDHFAITGGQLGKIGNIFYLVGGQRFDGLYNPMGHPTYTQTYADQIQKFTINNSGDLLSFDNYSSISDPVHLRRRDYNLIPQIFPDGSEGYTISSGVFQATIDLPFLYPVDINTNGYTPITNFNQYLSNYHSANACLYDNASNQMHAIFFGGMSQYYYESGELIQDDQVPFVKTISRLTRYADSSLQEYQLPVEMPALLGASAEFILNEDLPHFDNDIIRLNEIDQDTILIGHILGGIYSSTLNPFSNNQTSATNAENTVYTIKLIRGTQTGVYKIEGTNPFDFNLYPNPADNHINVNYHLEKPSAVEYFITASDGQLLQQGKITQTKMGENTKTFFIDQSIPSQLLYITLVLDHTFFVTKKLSKN
ncbi:MAG: hypothetical protein V2I62_13925 [Bacteroidales bacterium]|jgi:hypothetical protein|nr:hypothetical protein [Bacteroidales bacterium]